MNPPSDINFPNSVASPGTRSEPLNLYLREAGQTPLLTLQEETDLARRVRAGDQRARELMIRANLLFVIKIAKEYQHMGLSLLDLISEGNIGLVKAVDRFDPDRGAKVSTYAALWIRQQIRRALSNQSRTIRLPVHTAGQISELRETRGRLQKHLGRDATLDELAGEMGLPVRRVSKLVEAGIPSTSLDAPLHSDLSSGSLADVVADENAADPARQAEDTDALGRLEELLGRLPKREHAILRARFGLDDGEERTLETIGAKLGVTRERIRQLQQLALQRLRVMLEGSPPHPAAT